MPKFYGDIEKWLTFKNVFNELVHENSGLNDTEKFSKLHECLKGEASRKIDLIPLSSQSYADAWNLIKRTYDNKRILISRHLSLLLNMPSQEKDSVKGLSNLIDESNQHLHALESLGINFSKEIVVQVIEEKLNEFTRTKWEEYVESDEFPTLDHMHKFITKQLHSALSRQINNRSYANSHHYESPVPTKSRKTFHNRETEKTTNNFSAAKSAQTFALAKSESKCPACLNNH